MSGDYTLLALARKTGAAKTVEGALHVVECGVCDTEPYDSGFYWCADHPDYEPYIPTPRDPSVKPSDIAALNAAIKEWYLPVLKAGLNQDFLVAELIEVLDSDTDRKAA
jgi:hypothetical protein